jgi:hypothetical protein
MVLQDDSVNAASIRPNVPVVYNGVNLVSNTDQLISQRHGDAQYLKLSGGTMGSDINMG